MTKTAIIQSPVRKCGKRKKHGVYIVGGEGGDPDGVLLRFNRITPPVPYPVKLHRSPRIVSAYALLGRQPLDEWWEGASAETEVKKRGDAWALQTFGMTVHRRLAVGECAKAASADEAVAVLLQKVRWHNRIPDCFRELTVFKLQEIPRCAVEYNRLHEYLARCAENRRMVELLGAQAAVWRIAYGLPPLKRPEFIPSLMRILTMMGLAKDAAAMQLTFTPKECECD